MFTYSVCVCVCVCSFVEWDLTKLQGPYLYICNNILSRKSQRKAQSLAPLHITPWPLNLRILLSTTLGDRTASRREVKQTLTDGTKTYEKPIDLTVLSLAKTLAFLDDIDIPFFFYFHFYQALPLQQKSTGLQQHALVANWQIFNNKSV